MSKAQPGDTVKVNYIGTLENGNVFDQSNVEDPLEFTIGSSQLIPGFDQAVIDMAIGENKKITIPAEEAYGHYDETKVVEVTRSRLPDNMIPEVGQRLEVQDKNGDPIVVVITSLNKNTVVLDANHPLSDKDLTFEINLEEIIQN